MRYNGRIGAERIGFCRVSAMIRRLSDNRNREGVNKVQVIFRQIVEN